MIDLDITPTFITAQVHGGEWIDHGNYPPEALALLQPKSFLHGWKPGGDARSIDFDMPIDSSRFDRSGIPADVTIER